MLIDTQVMDIIESVRRTKIGMYGYSTLLKDDLDFNDSDIEEMVSSVENSFDIKILPTEINRLYTVGDVITIVKKRL